MSEILPTMPDTNIRKWIFVGAVCGILFIIVAFFVFMSRGGVKSAAGKNFSPEKQQILIWTVGMNQKVFSDLNAQFNKYVGRSDMKLVVQNFASFQDYIDLIPRMMQSKESPDLVMVPNHGGYRLFEPYLDVIWDTVVDFTDFENRFHQLFVEELVFSETINDDGQKKIIQWLRGIPFGFEPLGLYYNRELVNEAPLLWDNLKDILKAPEEEIYVPEAEDKNLLNVSSPTESVTTKIAFTNMGYGRETGVGPDIITLLTVQKKWEKHNSYTTINSIDSRTIFDYYLSFRREPNNLGQFDTLFAETLTTTDLFVRWKVATLFGYPSTYEDIKIAVQRAQQDWELAPEFLKNLRVATVPQQEIDAKKHTNFAKYMYFAVSKNGANRNLTAPQDDPVLKFAEFLLTTEAQDVFIKYPNYFLPTQQKTLFEKKDIKINPDENFDMTISNWYVPWQKFVLYDMWIPHLFREIVKQSIDEPGTTATDVTSFIASYLTCKIGQLTDPLQYSHGCLCRSGLAPNRNNYWPVCGQE